MSVTVEINISKRHGIVNPALFCENMESTRQTLFGGLTAQLINNRKFFAVTDGFFEEWNCEGSFLESITDLTDTVTLAPGSVSLIIFKN